MDAGSIPIPKNNPPGEAPLAMVTNLPEPRTLALFGLLVGALFVRQVLRRTFAAGIAEVPKARPHTSWRAD